MCWLWPPFALWIRDTERERKRNWIAEKKTERSLFFLQIYHSCLFGFQFFSFMIFFLGKIPYFWLFFHLNQDEILPYIRIKINIALSISICLSIHKSVLSKWSDSMRPNFQLCFKTMNVRYFCHLDWMNCIRIDCNRVPISSEKMRFSATGEWLKNIRP